MKIDIKNFQSIKESSIVVDGFTVVVGKTNIGKSSIIRSIKAALQNKRGNKFLRKGEKTCSVSLKDGKDVDILWEKGSGNKYVFGDKVYRNVGFNIPSEIHDSGFRSISLSNKDLSPQIAEQFDSLFLINESGGTCADILFDLSRINVLNEAQRLMEKGNRSYKGIIKTRKEDLREIQGKIDSLQGLGAVRKEFDALQSDDGKITCLRGEVQVLSDLMGQLRDVGGKVKGLLAIVAVNILDDTYLQVSISSHLEMCSFLGSYNQLSENIIKYQGISTIVVPEERLDTDIHDLLLLKQLNTSYNDVIQDIGEYRDVLKSEIPEEHFEQAILDIQEMQTLSSSLDDILPVVKKLKFIDDIIVPELLAIDIEDLSWLGDAFKTFTQIEDGIMHQESDLVLLNDKIHSIDTDIDQIKSDLSVCPLCEQDL